MKNTIVFIPSYDRPMQLDATLKSFYFYCDDAYNLDKFVLYKSSNSKYENAYMELSSEHKDTKFIKENNFKKDFVNILGDNKYILFSVDDTIYVNHFSINEMKSAIMDVPNSIGLSLRLGKNIKYCYSENKLTNNPNINLFSEIGFYDWTKEINDFGYPLEVSSSIYEINKLMDIFINDKYNNPNDLEWCMYNHAQNMKKYKHLLCYNTSRAFSSPINRVQTVNNNRSGNTEKYTPANLLDKFCSGYRIKIDDFFDFLPNSCHMEVDFDFYSVSNN